MAYTYHIYCKPTHQHYYSVKYANNCDPQDLGVTYTSSSKKVNEMIEKYGIDQFTFTVRKIFTTQEEAVSWEQKVLRRLNVLRRSDWLNQSIGTTHRATGPKSPQHKARIGAAHRGKTVSEKTRHKLSIAHKGSKRSQAVKDQMRSKRQDLVWLHLESTESTRLVHSHEVDALLEQGWKRGRPYFKKLSGHSEETRRQMSIDRNGKPNPKNSIKKRGLVLGVDVDGTSRLVTKEEFHSNPNLVGNASLEAKRRRSLVPSS